MSLFSDAFFVFLFLTIVLYYIIPSRHRWIVLLAASYAFYAWGDWRMAPFILGTTLTVWFGALLLDSIRENEKARRKAEKNWSSAEKSASKKRARVQQRRVFFSVLLINLGAWFAVKYFNFASESVVSFFNAINSASHKPFRLDFIVPLGISFYTLQAIGYLIDVYHGKYKPERNPFRFALFISFFPQVIQGPIGRYDALAPQFLCPSGFQLKNLENGLLLMLWGYFKKMVIADHLAPIVSAVFSDPAPYGGCIILFGLVAYAIQLYADFSGGIDIVSGSAEILGIHLSPNFKRPYFAASLGDFWRRWHISLGSWMRDYIFYPFALSKPVARLNKLCKGHVSDKILRALPAALGNILVFTLVGLWHGAQWNYIVWGLYNGLVLAASSLLEPLFHSLRERFPRISSHPLTHILRVLRTFVIVLIGYYFDCCPKVRTAFELMHRTLFDFRPAQLNAQMLAELTRSNALILGRSHLFLLAAVLVCAMTLLFAVSFLQERGYHIRDTLFRLPLLIRWAILLGFIFFFVTFAVTNANVLGGFMYEIF